MQRAMKRVLILLMASVVLGSLIFSGCAKEEAAPTLKIGVIAPLSGPLSTWGIPVSQGFEMVRDDINSKGGIEIGGVTYLIEVLLEDNLFTSEGAAAAANRLLEEEVDLCFASMVTHTTLATHEVLEPVNMLTINTANDDRVLTQANLSFRVSYGPTMLIPPQLNWIVKEHPEVKRFATINGNTESAWFASERISEFMRLPHVQLEYVADEYYEPGVVDFYPLLTKIIAADAQIIYSTDAPPSDWALIHKQASELGYDGLFVYGTCPPDAELLDIAGKEAAEGSIGVDYAVAGPNASNAAKAFKKLYEDTYQATYRGQAMMTAAPMYIILQLMQEFGTTDTAIVAAELMLGKEYYHEIISGRGFFGGKEVFGRNSQFYGDVWITEMQNGESVPVYKIPMADMQYVWEMYR